MGLGAILSYFWKKKTNTKSSTETELVDVDDSIRNILCSLNFLQEKGCRTTDPIIYQDNKSVILLESNSKISSGKRMKHIKEKYFFIMDKITDGEVIIKHILTYQMWADMNTKPMQGTTFRKDQRMMMNCDLELPLELSCMDKVKSDGRTNENKAFDARIDAFTQDNRITSDPATILGEFTGVCWEYEAIEN
eukprot:CCRYP_016003-RA/>CCRYP_016003-RA protein AED:0.47 eAED:0.47 QI:0/-1/0/1/-1/1/1/0/191